MKTFTMNKVEVQIIKEANGSYWGGFIYGFGDSRNYCGYLGHSLKKAFTIIRINVNL